MDSDDGQLLLSAASLLDPTSLTGFGEVILGAWAQGRIRKANRLAEELRAEGGSAEEKIEEFNQLATQHQDAIHLIVQRYFEDDEEEKAEYYACLIEGIAAGIIEKDEQIRYLKFVRQMTCRKIETLLELAHKLQNANSRRTREETDWLDVIGTFFGRKQADRFHARLRNELQRTGFWKKKFQAQRVGWSPDLGGPNDDFRKFVRLVTGDELDEWGAG